MEQRPIDPFYRQIVANALENNATEFQLITRLEHRAGVKHFARGMKKIIKYFERLVKASAEAYSEGIAAGKVDVGMLMAHCQYKTCVEFYKAELATANAMLKEYRLYVMSGHLLKTLAGIPRAERDMVDYRTLPVRPF